MLTCVGRFCRRRAKDELKCPLTGSEGAGCAYASPPTVGRAKTPKEQLADFKKRKARVIALYEIYVHLPELRAIWENPVTVSPDMEPYFAAACHGIELCFLLLSNFIKDPRAYLVKRSRIELICKDLVTQYQLLAELLSGHLEDIVIHDRDAMDISSVPPTVVASENSNASPGLELLTEALKEAFKTYSEADKSSLTKLVRTIVTNFTANLCQMSVGIGIEHQLNELADIVELGDKNIKTLARPTCIDYGLLVRPHITAATLLNEEFLHAEDFFFRTIHLGTECWAFIAHSRIDAAKEYASFHQWHQAAVQVRYASSILNYLGDHLMTLTALVIRDYLELKVEIQGTSGEGSLAVKWLRGAILELIDPLLQNLIQVETFSDMTEEHDTHLKNTLSHVYEQPEAFPGLYDYCKALESIESALLGGFYYKHFLLANNVIGSTAKGTMNRSVKALQNAFQTSCFPMLDVIRAELGEKKDKELAHNHGKIMDKIIERHRGIPDDACKPVPLVAAQTQDRDAISKAIMLEKCRAAERRLTARSPSTSPKKLPRFGSTLSKSRTTESFDEEFKAKDLSRRALFSDSAVIPMLRSKVRSMMMTETGPITDLQLLYHAWGQVPPRAMELALEKLYGMYTHLGNNCWDKLFSDSLPEAAGHIKRMLRIEADSKYTVEFGHNSHDLLIKVFSTTFDWLLRSKCDRPLCIVTSDSEFYSVTRQLNRLMELHSDRIKIIAVPASPVPTFTIRFLDEISKLPHGSIDFVYVSQITFLQQTLVPDIGSFSTSVRQILGQTGITIIDGYHSFGALPLSLKDEECIFVAGTLKHIGAGPNLAFAVIPQRHSSLRPVITGWLADISVLGTGSKGIVLGSAVGYTAGLTLMGSTPAFFSSVILFNEVMRLWATHCISINYVHQHVSKLQRAFLEGLLCMESQKKVHPNINLNNNTQLQKGKSLEEQLEDATRSHTLVFEQPCEEDAAVVVSILSSRGIAVDSRKKFVRIGFGLCHNPEDVSRLLAALFPAE